MTTPRPTVREIIVELRRTSSWIAPFAADALLGSNLPLDAPYYPEPQKFMAPKPQSTVGDYTWNYQKGDWEVKEIDGATDERDEEIDRLQDALSALADHLEYKGNSISWIHSKAEKYKDALLVSWEALNAAGIIQDRDHPFDVAEGIRRLALSSSPPGGVNAGAGLQDGPVMRKRPADMTADELTAMEWKHVASGFRECRQIMGEGYSWLGPLIEMAAERAASPPTPTPASTAGAVEELAACPFCGGDSEIDQFHPTDMNEWRRLCRNKECQAWGPERKTEAEAIAAWNRRASPASATIARLKEAVEGLMSAINVHEGEAGRRSWTMKATLPAAYDRAAQALADLAGGG